MGMPPAETFIHMHCVVHTTVCNLSLPCFILSICPIHPACLTLHTHICRCASDADGAWKEPCRPCPANGHPQGVTCLDADSPCLIGRGPFNPISPYPDKCGVSTAGDRMTCMPCKLVTNVQTGQSNGPGCDKALMGGFTSDKAVFQPRQVQGKEPYWTHGTCRACENVPITSMSSADCFSPFRSPPPSSPPPPLLPA